MGMITKDYVTLAFVLSIDNLFAKTLPTDIKNNVGIVNASGALRMGKDYNTTRRIKKRVLEDWDNDSWTLKKYSEEVMNLIVNCIYTVVTNFEVIYYNYFAPMTCILIQVLGYWYQERRKQESI